MWEPRRLTTLWCFTACYRDSFTFILPLPGYIVDPLCSWCSGVLIRSNGVEIAVFWDVAPCIYCVNRRFGGTYRLHLQDRAATYSRWFLARGFLYPEDGGDMFLRNVGLHNIYPGR
jgi:hypothetical protein